MVIRECVDDGRGELTYVHGVVVSCAAEGGQAAEEGEGAGV